MKNIQFKVIIIGLILVAIIIATSIWLFSKIPVEPIKPITLQTNNQTNKKQELAVLKQIFKDGVIIPQEETGQYKIESDDKIEYSVVDESLIKEKSVSIKLIDVDLDQDGEDEIVALTSLIFLGDACTSCRARLYIDVLDIEKDEYFIKNEQEFKAFNSELFNSDITIEKIQLIDINNDGLKEIQITFNADSYFGFDKTKVAILEWRNDQFRIIWQQVTYFNMDNYGALPEEDKQNYDATFRFEASDSEYPNIIVDKTILKDKGIELSPPRKEQLIYKWDTQKQEYYLYKEEKIGEEKLEPLR